MKVRLTSNEDFTVERGNVSVNVLDLSTKQDALISGTNIKTINNESILGSGNISIAASGVETDPVFSASAAASITSTDITNWNAAEANVQSDWNATSGDAQILNKPTNVSDFTNDVGYLTSFTEVDPVFTASAAAGITSSDIINWETAYTNNHTHSNKSVLDDISSSDISNWNSKTDNVGTITGITMNNTSKGTRGVVDLGTVITAETDPIYSASAAAGITSSDILNWNSKTDNVGTITGITMNGSSKGTSGVVDLGTVITSETSLSKGTTTGSGNAVTDITVSGHEITLTKGTTFLTEHP